MDVPLLGVLINSENRNDECRPSRNNLGYKRAGYRSVRLKCGMKNLDQGTKSAYHPIMKPADVQKQIVKQSLQDSTQFQSNAASRFGRIAVLPLLCTVDNFSKSKIADFG